MSNSIVLLTDLRQLAIDSGPEASIFNRKCRNMCPHAIAQSNLDRRTRLVCIRVVEKLIRSFDRALVKLCSFRQRK